MKIKFTHTNHGQFYRAEIDGNRTDKKEFFETIGLDIDAHLGFRLEHYVEKFAMENPQHSVDIYEMDVD